MWDGFSTRHRVSGVQPVLVLATALLARTNIDAQRWLAFDFPAIRGGAPEMITIALVPAAATDFRLPNARLRFEERRLVINPGHWAIPARRVTP